MTRKDFETIANALRSTKPREDAAAPVKDAWHNAVHSVAYALAGTSARYDRARFLRACGMYD